MSRSIAGFLAVTIMVLGSAGAFAKSSKFDGEYVGEAKTKIVGQKISVPVSFKVKNPRFTGKVLVPGANKVVTITCSLNGGTGHFVGFVNVQFGITGQFAGKITKAGNLSGTGTLFVPGYGAVSYKLAAERLEEKSPYRGTWVATHPPTQAIIRVDVFVTPQGIASLKFTTGSGQVIRDNREVSDDGQVNSVINSFTYFVKLNTSGKFTVSYQGVLGRGDLVGKRTSTGGVETSVAGTYIATNNSPTQGAIKLRLDVAKDRTLVGTFTFRDGSTLSFTNLVGDLNDFAGTTEGGINYFAKIAADGTFALDYQSAIRGNGTFSGKKK
ncbi:MAG: hypothetical protein ACREKL_12110 [Chthoniobacterales bacterium]